MLTVYGAPARVGVLNASPFVAKLETWLRLAGLPYTFKPGNPFQAPKGKMPYIDDDGLRLGDSQLILQHLTRKHALTLDADLRDEQRALAHSVRRTLEEGFYFVLAHDRWIDPTGWAAYKPIMRSVAPGLVLELIRRGVRRQLHAQGTGRHSPDEISAMGIADLGAVAQVLGDKPYLLGSEPSGVDATAFAFVEGTLAFPGENRVRSFAQQQANLVAYADRMRERFWSGGLVAR